MEKVLFITTIITAVFGIFKLLEMKYLERHMKPVKELIRDLFIVFLATFLCLFIMLNYQHKIDDFMAVITNTVVVKPDTTQVFTGTPDF